MPRTATPRKMTARELEAARKRVRDQFFAPYQTAQLFGMQLPGMLKGIGNEALGSFRAGTEYVLDTNTQKDIPKDINRAGKAVTQNAGSYLDILNTVYQSLKGDGMVAKPDYYRNMAGRIYQEQFNPEPADPRLERALNFYADPLAVGIGAGRAARGLADPKLYRQIAEDMARGARSNAIDVWHGSPHKFEQFTAMDNIGKGEGAQAYGHGGYHAGNRNVAEGYRRGLSNRDFQNLARDTYNQFDDADAAVESLLSNPSLSDNQRELISALQADDWLGFDYPHQAIDEVLKNPDKWDLSQRTKDAVANTGNLYRNELRWPDPAREAADPLSDKHFFEWEKPLSEQSDFVKQAVIDSGLAKQIAAEQGIADINYVGARHFESPENSRRLAEAGIPGIRYLDAGSRPANVVDKELYALYEKYGDVEKAVDEMMKGVYNTPKVKQQMREGYIKQLNEQKQTHNYVTFSDDLVNILERNGVPVTAPQPGLSRIEAPQAKALREAQINAAKPVSEGGLGLRPDNTPEERAAAMGFDTDAYHATGGNIEAFDMGMVGDLKSQSLGIHATNSAEEASGYAKSPMREGAQRNILPLLLNMGGARYYDTFKTYPNRFIDSRGLRDMVIAEKTYGDNVGLKNYLLQDPSRIRSRFAAFDPMRRDSSDLLAGLALPVVAAPVVSESDKKKRKDKKK